MGTSIGFAEKNDQALGMLKQILRSAGIIVTSEDALEHGVKLRASYQGASFGLVLYFAKKTGRSSKVVIEKGTEEITRIVTSVLNSPFTAGGSPAHNPLLEAVKGRTHIGIDESGKGDYFGPLVIAGVCINPEDEARLIDIGVKDSKLLPDKQVAVIACNIKALLGEWKYEIAYINPEKYNQLYSKIRNLNRLLAWGHARVLENLLEKNRCDLAVCDQFGDESYVKNALMTNGKAVTLLQTPKGERDSAVAAASILARDTFVRRLREISDRYGISFPKGSSSVVEAGKRFLRQHGQSELGKVAKLHFKTTEKVLYGS